jgi:hypothetical protein
MQPPYCLQRCTTYAFFFRTGAAIEIQHVYGNPISVVKSDQRLLTIGNRSLQLLHNSAYCEPPGDHETQNFLHTSTFLTRDVEQANDYFSILLPLIE